MTVQENLAEGYLVLLLKVRKRAAIAQGVLDRVMLQEEVFLSLRIQTWHGGEVSACGQQHRDARVPHIRVTQLRCVAWRRSDSQDRSAHSRRQQETSGHGKHLSDLGKHVIVDAFKCGSAS